MIALTPNSKSGLRLVCAPARFDFCADIIGDKELVFAKFFFWKPGSSLQKSLTGLFRSLLHDTLEACPELIPVVLPEQWAQVKSMPWQTQTDVRFRKEQIRNAFIRMIEHRDYLVKHCFCFFIDGLDEYEETIQEDYLDMVKLLSGWTAAAPEAVKICVSSREYNVFLNYFSKERRICLQDLTRPDMERYIRDKLRDMDIEAEKAILIKKIADKASGIFLWVALVVKSIREMLSDGYGLFALEQELDSLPGELEKLFKYLLDSMEKSARRRAYQTFAMILKSRSYDFDLSLFSYSFLEQYEIDTEFAVQSFFLNDTARKERLDIARKRLNGCCKGLLEPRGGDDVISFTHRSVPEFLETDDMASYLTGFSPENAVSQLALAELRSKEYTYSPELLSNRVYTLIKMRNEANIDYPPYRFRECLHSTMVLTTETDAKNPWNNAGRIYVGTDFFYMVWNDHPNTSPLHISAFLGDHEYVSWKMERDPHTTDSGSKKSVLLAWITIGALYAGHIGCVKLLEFLLEQGLSPNVVFRVRDLCIPSTPELQDIELSFWQLFISWALAYKKPDRENNRRSKHKRLGELIEKFVKYGADSQMCISIQKEMNGHSKLTFGKDQQNWLTRKHISICGLTEFTGGKGGTISVRELIQYWKLDNNDILLQLIDRNLAEQEQGAKESWKDHEQSETDLTQDVGTSEPKPTFRPAFVSKMGVTAQFGEWKYFGVLPQFQITILFLGECSLQHTLVHGYR